MNAEFANRLRDPFETNYMGVLRTNDPLLIERGNGGVELYRDLKRDGKVFSGLQKRQLALIGKPFQVEPVGKDSPKASADALQVTEILKGCSFDHLCSSLLEALLAGHAVAEVVWAVRDGQVVPARVPKRAQRRFVYVQDDENSPPQLQMLTRESMLKGIPVPDRKFIVHRVNPEDDNPYGTGLGLQLWWPVYFKRKGIVAWNKLNDRFGSPTPHGKYPRLASDKEKRTLVDALRAMSNDGYLATPEGMEIDLLESKLAGNVTTQEQLVRYMDEWIAEVLTGQEPAGKGGGALAAASKERQNVRQDLTQADSDLLSETLNETLIKWICELNGFEPCQVYRQVKEEEDTKSIAQTDKIIHEMGYELDEDTLRSKYGEGWTKKAPPVVPPPLMPTLPPEKVPPVDDKPGSAPAVDDKLASFAEAASVATTTSLTRRLGVGSGPLVDGWVEQLRDIVNNPAYADPESLQEALLGAYGELPTEQLQELMQLAFTLAELQGMDDAATESSGG
jgi:phage gp29-like protein